MGLATSKETTQWNQPDVREILCGGCDGVWEGGGACGRCGRKLIVPKSVESTVRNGTEATVLLGIPAVYPVEADIARLDKYWGRLDNVRKTRVLFTQRAEYLSIPSAIMTSDSAGVVEFLYNPLSPVVINASRVLRDDPTDTTQCVRHVYELLVSLSTWPLGSEVSSSCTERLRMNVLTHGPQRFHTSLFKTSMLKYNRETRRVKLQGGYPMVMSLARRDAAATRELNNTRSQPTSPPPTSTGLYMWTPSLLNMLAPPLTMPDFIKADRLLALSFFFKVPLVDRCDVLNATSCLRLKGMDPIPSFTESDKAKYKNTSLDDIMSSRAAAVLHDTWAKGKLPCVLWSGGIDSTAVMISLLRELGLTGDGDECVPGCPVRKGVPVPVLYVGFSEAAVEEYPWFYENVLEKYRRCGVLGYMHISQIRPVSLQLDLDTYQYITGECGDQMFGSDMMSNAYDLTSDAAWTYSAPPNPSAKESYLLPFRMGLQAVWRDTLLESLVQAGFVNPDEKESWVEWITPQLQRAPFEIKTTFDILWWLNYSCKWQHVVLRILNFRETMNEDDLAHVTHFFRSDPFQLWSFSNHHLKLPDQSCWATYKEPLKAYILKYTRDDDYYRYKLKCGSLGYIMLQNDTAEHDVLGIDSTFELIKSGAHSISPRLFREKYGDTVKATYLSRRP